MTKELFVLLNITFILLQLILFFVLLNRYIKELNKVRESIKEEIININNKYKDNLTFIRKELKYTFNQIENKLLHDQNNIKNDLIRCNKMVDDLLDNKLVNKIIYQPVNLKKLLEEIKNNLYKNNIIIDLDIEDEYCINGDYNLLMEAFTLIIKYYYKNNINIKVKKYGKYYNVEFISSCTSCEIECDTVIDYISKIISSHKGLIRIKNKDTLKITIVILPMKKRQKTF